MTRQATAPAAGRDLHWIEDPALLLQDAERLQNVRDNIAAGDVYIACRQFDPELLQEIRKKERQKS